MPDLCDKQIPKPRNPWQEWREQHKTPTPQPPAPKPAGQKEPAPTRLITESELAKIKQLQRVSTSWGSSDHRFIHQFEDVTSESMITDRQGWWIDCLYYKYRRQLKATPPKPAGYQGRGQ